MGTITKLNDVLCANINKVDDILKSSIKYWDDNTFCPPTPTPTPTPTSGPTSTPTPTPTRTPEPTPTPTPTPVEPTPTPTPTCVPDCCPANLCYDRDSCRKSCECNDIRSVYLKILCVDDPCLLAFAGGIYDDDTCTTPAQSGYYSDGNECYLWVSGTITLTYQGPC